MNLKKSDKPLVIILNGPTSAGKSLISHFLQEIIDVPFLHIGIDILIDMMPHKMNNWEGQRGEQGFWWKEETDSEGNSISIIQMGDYAKKISETHKEVVHTLVLNEHNVIVDEIAFGQQELNVWKAKLSNCYIFFIGVTAKLEVLEKRERERGNRKIGSARHQLYNVHKNVIYDLLVDTSNMKPEECALQIVDFINSQLP